MTGAPAPVAAFLAALEDTQYLAPDRMDAYQRRLLDKLLRHARAETDFHADRLAPVFRADDSIAWERWRELPILLRTDAQENFERLAARTMPKMAGNASEDSSSGSTGRPLRHLTCDIQNIASACASERFFRWHGLDPAKLTARIRAASSPEAAWPTGRPTTGWRIGHADSRVIDLAISATVDQQREWLQRIRPDYLASYPSNLRELARIAEAAGERLRFHAIMTFGEMVTEDARMSIRDYFGHEPLDRYGTSECGHITSMCPLHAHHISSELVLVELLDDDGAPVPAGSPGRVIVTPFYNFAMPLIRYDVGDYAVLSPEPCACGRTLPVLEKILGRARNVFRLPDGTSVWPVLLSKDLRRFVPTRQFQVVQASPTAVDFRYVPETPGQPADLAGLTAYIRARLHPTLSVTATPVEAIRRSAGGKFEDYVRLFD